MGAKGVPKGAQGHPKGAKEAQSRPKGTPKDAQREPKGTPKETKRAQSRPKGKAKAPTQSKRDNIYIYKLLINRPSGRYVNTKSPGCGAAGQSHDWPDRLLFSIIIRDGLRTARSHSVRGFLQSDLVPGLVPLGSGLLTALVPNVLRCIIYNTLVLFLALVPAWFHLVPTCFHTPLCPAGYSFYANLVMVSGFVPVGTSS